MTNIELVRPIEWKQLCDWAFTTYLKYRQDFPNLSEKEIAESMFVSEYNATTISPELKELAGFHISEAESIPDLIYEILRLEVFKDKNMFDLTENYVDAVFYCIKNYLKLVDPQCHLVTIAKVFQMAFQEIDKKISDENLSTKETVIILNSLLLFKVYKQWDTSEKLNDAIKKMLNSK